MKGGSFEREICVALSLWWTDGKRDDIFGRSDSSGGRFTARKKAGKDTANMAGDVTFTDISGESLVKAWSIETKTGYGGREKVKDSSGRVVKKIQRRWDLLDILDSSQKQTVFESMWGQCRRDADLTCREPVLIFRRNQRKVCMAVTANHMNRLKKYYGPPTCKLIRYDHGDFRIIVLPLKDGLEWLHNFSAYLSAEIH